MKKKELDKSVKKILIIVSIPVIAVSIIFLLMGINTLNQQSYLRKVCTAQTNGIVYDFRVTGTVIENDDGSVTDYRTYIPLFEYEVRSQTYNLESGVGTKEKRFKLGQEVIVMYNTDKPAESYVPEDKNNSSGILIIVLAGILLTLDIAALIKVFVLKEFV